MSRRTPLNKISTLAFLAKVEELAPLIEARTEESACGVPLLLVRRCGSDPAQGISQPSLSAA